MGHVSVIADSSALTSWRARPRSFVALMGLYESNYTRLGWLVEDIGALEGVYLSVVDGDCELLLTVTDRSPYTATFTLTYLLPDRSPPDREARSAATTSSRCKASIPCSKTMDMRSLGVARLSSAIRPSSARAARSRLRT